MLDPEVFVPSPETQAIACACIVGGPGSGCHCTTIIGAGHVCPCTIISGSG